MEQAGVDVGEEVFFAPFEPERVAFLREGGVQRVALDVGPPPGVVGRVGAPVQRARDDVVAALGVGVVVASRLGNVDFAGLGPWAVLGFDRQHPDTGPEPVSSWEVGGDFDASVLDRGSGLGVDAARLDRVDDRPVGDIRDNNTVGV